MDITPGTLIYPSPGVLTQVDGGGTPEAITVAHRPSPDTIIAHSVQGQDDTYTIDPNALQSYDAGLVKFTDNSGTAYEIRPLDDSDGQWLSRYHTNVPADALRNMISGRGDVEGTKMSHLLKGENETMVAFQFPDDDFLFGLLYMNQFGAYIYTDGQWVLVPPEDDTFDDTYPFLVNSETVDDFIDAWDRGPVGVDDAQSNNWVTAPPEPEDQPSEPEIPDSVDNERYNPDTDSLGSEEDQ